MIKTPSSSVVCTSQNGFGMPYGVGAYGVGSAGVSTLELTSLDSILALGTYTRNDTTAMTRNADGSWTKAAANAAYSHYNLDGTLQRLLVTERAATNKCTNVNWQPTDLTGLTAGGNASGTVTISTHPVHGFPTICITNNIGGSGTKYANIGGTFANTNVHSMSVQAYVEAGANGNNAFINDSGGSGTVNGSSSVPVGEDFEIKSEGFTPTVTTRTMRINAGFGSKIHFWLNSLEEASTCSLPVYCNGASGSRVQARFAITDLSLLGNSFNQSQGTLAVVAYVPSVTNVDMLPAIFSDGSTSNTIGLRLYTDGFLRPNVSAGGVTQTAQSVSRIIAGRNFPLAMTWGSGGYNVIAGAGRTRRETGQTLPTTAFTRLDIGSRYNGSQGFTGGINKIVISNARLSHAQLGALLMDTGGRGVIAAGQSLVDNLRRSDVDQNNNGEIAFNAQLDTTWSATAGNNWLLHGAIGGAGVLYKNTTGGAWYYDDDLDTWGDAWQYTQDVLDFFIGGGGSVEGIIFDGAQQDAGAVELLGQDYIDVYDGIKGIISKIRGIVGSNIPAVIMPTVGRTDAGLQERYQYLRELQWDIADAEDEYYRGPETFDLPKGDVVHLSAAGYTTSGSRSSRKMLAVLGESITGEDGPTISGVSRAGATITVTLSHDTGTDFTPTTGIEGFYYIDETGASVAISSAVRTNATTITITLASSVAGTLYYGYGWMYGLTATNFVKDNSANTMPLRSFIDQPYTLGSWSYLQTCIDDDADTEADEIHQPDLMTYSQTRFVKTDGAIILSVPENGISNPHATPREELEGEYIAWNQPIEHRVRFTLSGLNSGNNAIFLQFHEQTTTGLTFRWNEGGAGTSNIRIYYYETDNVNQVSDSLLTGLTMGDIVDIKVRRYPTKVEVWLNANIDGVTPDWSSEDSGNTSFTRDGTNPQFRVAMGTYYTARTAGYTAQIEHLTGTYSSARKIS